MKSVTQENRRKPQEKAGPLKREAIVDAAAALIRKEGAGALSVRRLAVQLNVSPMALYRHLEDKQDLLAAVLAQLISKNDVCAHTEKNWRAWMVETCARMRQSLSDNPEILPILSETKRMSALEIATFEAILKHLVGAGLTEEKAAKVFHMTVSFTFGSLAFDQFKTRKLTGKSLPGKKELTSAYPTVAAAARYLAAPLSDREFKQGLERILRGF